MELKTININFEKGHWDPRTQSLILEYDKTTQLGFNIRAIPVYNDVSDIKDVSQANDLLSKFKKPK